MEALTAFATDTFGRVDLAVNNAGIANESRMFHESDTDDVRHMLSVNTIGVYLCMKHQIRQMLADGGGSIVNVASVSATKHAVAGLTKAAAPENAIRNIRVNPVAPGATRTEMTDILISQGVYDVAALSKMHPMERLATPEEIAYGICWLLSDEASFVTGHIPPIDGGFAIA